MACEHLDTVIEEDSWGHQYVVCEDCGTEVETEDTRDFEAIIADRAERRRPDWAR